jgi:uncharacterized protein (DUF2147 family)
MKVQTAALAFFCIVLGAMAGASAAPADVFGVWLTKDGTGHVEIKPCGTSACGVIIWGKEGSGPETDVKNPNPELRTRQLIGLRILENFTRRETGWFNGRIYDPKSGNTYRSELAARPDGTLGVKGCVGPICRTEIWRRVR